MASLSDFESTPIKEIIFTISFSSDVEMSCLEKFKELPEIATKFSNQEEQYTTQINNIEIFKPTTTFVKNGFLLKSSPDDNKVLQIKTGVFSFHKINQYEQYHNLLSELIRYWELFTMCLNSKISITRVSLRYINFIKIEGKETLKDLVNINTNHPFNKFVLNSNFNKIQFNYNQGDNTPIDVTLVTSMAKDKDKDGVLLDIILNKQIPASSKQTLQPLFEGMRNIKNYLFEQSITTTTFDKYVSDTK